MKGGINELYMHFKLICCDEIHECRFGVEMLIENERNFLKGFENGALFEHEEDHLRWCFIQFAF